MKTLVLYALAAALSFSHAGGALDWRKEHAAAKGASVVYRADVLVQEMTEGKRELSARGGANGAIFSEQGLSDNCANHCSYTFSVPTAQCERMASDLAHVGSVRHVASDPSRKRRPDDAELSDKIEALKGDIRGHEGVLDAMPAVGSLVKSKLAALEEAREARRLADERCEFTVTLRR